AVTTMLTGSQNNVKSLPMTRPFQSVTGFIFYWLYSSGKPCSGPGPSAGLLWLIQILHLLPALALDALGKRGFEQIVDIAIEHDLRVGAGDARSQVLHHLIGLQNIITDLVAPADIGLGRSRSGGGLLALFQLGLIEPCTEHLPG